MDKGGDDTAQPVRTSDALGQALTKLMEWLPKNVTAAIAILTALGFVMGGVILAAFAAGLGVAPTDFGLDVRATVTLAAGTLLYPGLLSLTGLMPHPRKGAKEGLAGAIVAKEGLAGAIVAGSATAITFWWFLDLEIWQIAALSAFLAVCGLIFFRVMDESKIARSALDLLLGGSQDQSNLGKLRKSLGIFLVSMAFMAIVLPSLAWKFGADIREDSRGVVAPRIVQFVLPVTRGMVTVATNAVCVDRVRERVMVGDSSSAVVPVWDGFVVEDCERGDVSDLFESSPP